MNTVQEISPLGGLRRRGLGQVEVLAQSVGASAPTAAMATTPALVAGQAGSGLVLCYAAAAVIAMVVGWCVAQFARRMSSSGSLYSFVARGLGPTAAVLTGLALTVGYLVLAAATLMMSADYLVRCGGALGLPPGADRAVAVGLVCVLGLLVAMVMVRGIALSARVMLAVEAVAATAVVLLLAVFALRGGLHLGLSELRPSAPVRGVARGVALAVAGFIGFESGAALGSEARRPHRSVPRVVLQTVVGLGLLYLVVGWATLAGMPGGARQLAATPAPLPVIAARLDVAWLAPVVDVAVAGSAFACAVASLTALTRLLFSMAREGVVPGVLGRTSRRFQTPHVAVLACAAVATLAPVVLLAGGVGLQRAITALLTLATFGYLLAYVVVCLALPRFLGRIGESSHTATVAGGAGAVTCAALLVAYSWPLSSGTYGVLLWSFVGVLVLGTAGYRLRRPGRIGVYDEPIAADLLFPTALTPQRQAS